MQLSLERVDGASPRAEILFLHGILGRGANLRTLAKRFVADCPGWSAVLLDLRGHGGSRLDETRGDAREPATLAQCARDVTETTAGDRLPRRAIVGHSFGGKVALEIARLGAAASDDGSGGAVAPGPTRAPAHFVVLDALPGQREGARGSETTVEVLAHLASLPGPFPRRQDFIAALCARGLAPGIAEWLATSLRRGEDGFRFGIDLGLVRALLDDYFASDLWPVVASPAGGASVHLVVGERSSVFDASDRARALALEAARPDRVTVDVLPAGHWVHVDAPDALLEVLVRRVGPAPEGGGT